MIDIKSAAQKAMQHFSDVYSEEEYTRVHVEEIELAADKKSWWVIIGFDDMPQGSLGLDLFQRSYKRLQIDAETSDLTAIKVHQMA